MVVKVSDADTCSLYLPFFFDLAFYLAGCLFFKKLNTFIQYNFAHVLCKSKNGDFHRKYI